MEFEDSSIHEEQREGLLGWGRKRPPRTEETKKIKKMMMGSENPKRSVG